MLSAASMVQKASISAGGLVVNSAKMLAIACVAVIAFLGMTCDAEAKRIKFSRSSYHSVHKALPNHSRRFVSRHGSANAGDAVGGIAAGAAGGIVYGFSSSDEIETRKNEHPQERLGRRCGCQEN